jgi:hypothetical protein
MRITHRTPIIVRDGHELPFTSQVIADLLATGLTAADYEALALAADFYALSIAELMAIALEREAQR